MSYRLTCAICSTRFDGLVEIQEHVMRDHGYTHDDLSRQTHHDEQGALVYTMPDGVNWLIAERVTIS